MIRYLNDLNCFLNKENCENKIIYTYDNIIPEENENNLLYGITTIYNGDINGEFYMTKGHKHLKDTSEVYFCLEGEGIILEKDEEGKEYTHYIEKNKIFYIKPKNAHRAINTGTIPLKLLCVCRADSGHDYNINFNNRFFNTK